MKKRLKQLRELIASPYRIAALENQINNLKQDVDALKSSLEVSPGVINEFAAWKRSTPVPARPLISVCVVTYNRSRLLTERCIPSILQQTYTHFELIIVGDGCTDDTASKVSAIRDPRLKFINLPQRETYPEDPILRWMVAGNQASNKARSMAQGDYVTQLDDDDEYVPERLERLVEFAVTNRWDLVWHPFWAEESSGTWRLIEAPTFMCSYITSGSVLYRRWLTKIEGTINAHRLLEPGDWNRFRRMKYIGATLARYPEPLLKHYKEKTQ